MPPTWSFFPCTKERRNNGAADKTTIQTAHAAPSPHVVGMGLSFFFDNTSTPASYFQSSPSCVPCPSWPRSSSPRATSPRAPTACPYRSGGAPGRTTSRFRSLEPLPRMFSGLVPTAPLTAGLPPCYHHPRSCRCAMATPPSPSQRNSPGKATSLPGGIFLCQSLRPAVKHPARHRHRLFAF